MIQRLIKPTIISITLLVANHTENVHGFFGVLTGWYSVKSGDLKSRENIKLVEQALKSIKENFKGCELVEFWIKDWIIGKSYWAVYTCKGKPGVEQNCMLHFRRKFNRLVSNELPICQSLAMQRPAKVLNNSKPVKATIECQSLKEATVDGECDCDCATCCEDYCACSD